MNRKQLLIASLFVCFTAGSQASELKIEWLEPETFIDIRSANLGQARFEASVLQELSDQFQSSAQEYLPDKQTLLVQVTNLDLAGRIDYSLSHFGSPYRIIHSSDYPSLSFSYEIQNEEGVTVASGEERIHHMNLSFALRSHRRSDTLYHEKVLIDDWFKRTF